MNYQELLQKYSVLLSENQKLQKEIKTLKEQFGIIALPFLPLISMLKSGRKMSVLYEKFAVSSEYLLRWNALGQGTEPMCGSSLNIRLQLPWRESLVRRY